MHNKLIILAFKTAVRWMKIPTEQTKQKTRFPEQWVSFNCAIGTSDDAVLWFKKDIKSEEKLQVIDTRIRLVSTNTFNITSLTRKDRGFYRCKVCGKLEETIIFLEILEGKLALKVTLNLLLEIHACNNPSPGFKRCILSAVASTSSQWVCEVR
jgi:hypothetical protein